MKKAILLLMAIVLLALPAFAQIAPPSRMALIDGCEFVREVEYCTPGADTLWFTKATPNVNAALFTAQKADWFKPFAIPVGTNTAGELLKQTRRVKAVHLYSRQQFSYRAFYPGGTSQSGDVSSGAVYCLADSVGRSNPLNAALPKYPAHTVIYGYPDSIRVKESGSDTVKVRLGY